MIQNIFEILLLLIFCFFIIKHAKSNKPAKNNNKKIQSQKNKTKTKLGELGHGDFTENHINSMWNELK